MKRWLYYIVENAWIARVGDDGIESQILKPDGSWEPINDVWKICVDGRPVTGKEEALEEAREIFAHRGLSIKDKWRYFVVLNKIDGRVVHALSYRDVENPKGDVDPLDTDRNWYRELFDRYPQSRFVWRVIAMPAGTSPHSHPRELQEALKDPLVSDSWPSNDEYPE